MRIMLPKSSKISLISTPCPLLRRSTLVRRSHISPSAMMKYSRKMNRSAFSMADSISSRKSLPVGRYTASVAL
jgi:hypothetical protein